MNRYRVTVWLDGKHQYSTGYGRKPVAVRLATLNVEADASDTAAQVVAVLYPASARIEVRPLLTLEPPAK
jgi:hypothetical protein